MFFFRYYYFKLLTVGVVNIDISCYILICPIFMGEKHLQVSDPDLDLGAWGSSLTEMKYFGPLTL